MNVIVNMFQQKKNKELYEEIYVFLGIYIYVKDKLNIKPYIIIEK